MAQWVRRVLLALTVPLVRLDLLVRMALPVLLALTALPAQTVQSGRKALLERME